MGVFSNLYQGLKGAFSVDAKQFIMPLGYGEAQPQSGFTNYQQYLNASKEVSWVYKCVSTIGEGIALTTGAVYDQNDDEIKDTTLEQIFKTPNDFMSWFDMKEGIVWYLLLSGNCFILKDELNGLGQPTKLWLMRPDRMEVVPSKSEFIAGYAYKVNNQRIPFRRDEIIHIKLPNPLNPFLGMGKIEACRIVYDTDKAASMYNWKFFENGASPSGILKNEGKLDEDSFNRLVDMFEGRHKGFRSMQKPLFLEQGTSYQQLGLSQTDMAFMEQRKFTREEILSIFGVPPMKAGVLENASYANTKEQEGTYRKDTLMPLLRRLEERFTMDLIRKFNPNWRFEFENVVVKDEQAYLTMAQQGINSGILTPNEAREFYLELPVVEDEAMNTYYMPFSLAPITGDLSVIEPAPAPTLNEEQTPQDGEASQQSIEIKKGAERSCKEATEEISPAEARRRMSRIQLGLYRISVEARKKLGVRVKKTAKSFFGEQKQRVLDLLKNEVEEKKFDLKAINWADIFDDEAELKAFQKAMVTAEAPIIQNAAENTFEVLGGTMPDNFMELPKVREAIGRLGRRVTGIYETTINELNDTLNEGIAGGESIPDLARRVEEVYDRAEGYRSIMIARTESAFAYDRGAIVGYSDLGIKFVDVVGCTEFEPDSDCGKQGIPIDEADQLEFHPNHVGTVVPSASEL